VSAPDEPNNVDDDKTGRFHMPAPADEWICDECGEQVTGKHEQCPLCGAAPKKEEEEKP
jgi:rubrerythrin